MEGTRAMSEPKPLASLDGGLLARKGGAKPAMRSQMMQPYAPLGSSTGGSAGHLEDLGWNDMGDSHDTDHQANILPLTPSPINAEAEAEARAEDEIAAAQLAENAHRIAFGQDLDEIPAKPVVVRQQEEIAEKLLDPIVHKPNHAAPKVPASMVTGPVETVALPATEPVHAANVKTAKPARRKSRRQAADSGRRAAFTLRLDAERHLKLRLACTVRNRSAQQVVTEALDRLLNAMPEIEALAAQVKRH